MSEETLVFTGERFLPSCEREIWYEHYHRYAMALPWVAGLTVVDAACGEGYGSHLLASQASEVIGFDLSEAAVKHAQSRYQSEHLRFEQADVLDLPLADDSVDVVVSFETLEHLAEHDALLASFKRILKPGGVLLISTPDKAVYSDATGFQNEFHVKELYHKEFESLLNSHFKHHQMLGQKLLFSSHIWRLDGDLDRVRMDAVLDDGSLATGLPFQPVYLLAVASDAPIENQQAPDVYGFTEQPEAVYGHYHAVIRAHIEAEKAQQQLQQKQSEWLNHPIIGRVIRWLGKE